jgi:NADPH:quinone reductase-like Zn-dependent oxidoreductase
VIHENSLTHSSHCDGLLTGKATNAGFQQYSTCLEILVSAVPDSVPLANAAVLPLATDTASAGLFHVLGLPFPTLTPKSLGKSILIWGGSSSVGSSAIQLAVAAGYTVATTASIANHEYVKSLGATHILNYKDPQVVEQILKVLKPEDLVIDCIGCEETQITCGKILSKLGGGKLAAANFPQWPLPENVEGVFSKLSVRLKDFYCD